MTEKIVFTMEDTGEEVELYVIEETRVNGRNYLLVTDSDEDSEEGEAYILKDMSSPEDTDALYEMVEDEEELDSVSKIFEEMLEDITLE